eukprot:350808-Chlamydomonas_euryale.AAC.8
MSRWGGGAGEGGGRVMPWAEQGEKGREQMVRAGGEVWWSHDRGRLEDGGRGFKRVPSRCQACGWWWWWRSPSSQPCRARVSIMFTQLPPSCRHFSHSNLALLPCSFRSRPPPSLLLISLSLRPHPPPSLTPTLSVGHLPQASSQRVLPIRRG